MKRTNQKGVTLISLIVTIIVLIIIAGISIATLTGDNGVLKQTSTSKAEQLKATAREQVELACSAVKLAIEEAVIKDNNYSALQNSDKIQSVLLNALNTDKTGLNGEFEEGTNAENSIEIIYDGEDYKNATNNPDAKITYTIALGKNSIEIADVKTGTEVGGNGSNEEKNEYGFYYNKPYTMTTVDSNGNEKKEYYVFKENGEVEYYINGNKDGISVQGFLESAMPENTATYGENTITYNGQTLTVSEDGSTITMGANSLVCTDEEYRDIYFGKLYK